MKNIMIEVTKASIMAHGVVKSVLVKIEYKVNTATSAIVIKYLPNVIQAAITTTAPPLASATMAAIKLTM